MITETTQILSWIMTTVGFIGFIFVGRKEWWGWYINLACQILWAIYALATAQPAFLAFAAAYFVIFAFNAYKWTKDHRVAKKIWESEPGTVTKFGNATITRLPDDSKEESNLVQHARHELKLIGEDFNATEWYIRVIKEYSRFGHSGGSAWATLQVLEELLRFRPLTELTDDPEEWLYHGADMWDGKNGVWQNKRDGRMFSEDGGKTYTCVDDPKDEDGTREVYHSISKEQWLTDHADVSAN
jgi:hypothetical protein